MREREIIHDMLIVDLCLYISYAVLIKLNQCTVWMNLTYTYQSDVYNLIILLPDAASIKDTRSRIFVEAYISTWFKSLSLSQQCQFHTFQKPKLIILFLFSNNSENKTLWSLSHVLRVYSRVQRIIDADLVKTIQFSLKICQPVLVEWKE